MRAMAGAAPDRAQLLLELIRDVTSTLDLQEVLDRSLAAVRRVIEFDDIPAEIEAMANRETVGRTVALLDT